MLLHDHLNNLRYIYFNVKIITEVSDIMQILLYLH